jgi:hypothetical protein
MHVRLVREAAWIARIARRKIAHRLVGVAQLLDLARAERRGRLALTDRPVVAPPRFRGVGRPGGRAGLGARLAREGQETGPEERDRPRAEADLFQEITT